MFQLASSLPLALILVKFLSNLRNGEEMGVKFVHDKTLDSVGQDIPDVRGDKEFGIRSFSVRLGQKRVTT